MRFMFLVLLASGLGLASVPVVPADDKDDDAKRIQGAWVVDPATFEGLKNKEELKEAIQDAMKMRFTFQGDTLTIKHAPEPPPFEKGREEKVSFRLDPTKKPKQIDMSDGVQGIYELDGDTLKLCWDHQSKLNGRPTKLAHDKDRDSVHYFVLKREKKK